MILIHTGVLPQEATKDGIELCNPKDYPNVRLEIRKAFKSGQDCNIYVKHRACDEWFWDLHDYGNATIINDDPRERLKRNLNLVALPPDLSSHPDWIIELRLLELPTSQKVEGDVWTWILNEKLGPSWSAGEPSFDHLGSIVIWYLSNATTLDSLATVLKQRQRLAKDQWVANAKGELRSAYEQFFGDPAKNSVFLTCWQNLEKYYVDELDRWLQEVGCHAPSLIWVAFKLPPLPFSADVGGRFSTKVRAYWNGRLAKGNIELQEALAGMSGLLLGELEAVVNCVRRGLISVDRLQIEGLRAKFAGLANASSLIDAVKVQLPPKEITEPNDNWAEDSWITWAANEYIPYKKWLIDRGKGSSVAEKYCSLYENWLFSNYPAFVRRAERLILTSFKYIKTELVNGSAVIWVLVDNLPLFWHDLLSGILSEIGFLRPTPPMYLLSMIPSETSICRPSILLGKLPRQVKNVDVNQAIEEEWKRQGIGAKISHSIEELDKQVAEGGDLFVLIYNTLDYLAHQPDHEVTDREETVRFHLRYLSQYLHKVMKQIREIRQVKLVISSDHGSTKISTGAQNLIIPSSAQIDEALQRHSRFVRVTDFQSLSPLEWFFLEGERFGLPENYAIVKGDRYVGTRPLGYTHGGMSPEETITALSVWQLGQIPAEVDVSVFHTSSPIVRGKPQQLAITIRNPFAFNIRNLSVFLPTVGAHFETKEVPAQAEAVVGPAEVRLPPKYPVANGVSEVDMVISYEVAGRAKQRATQLQIKIRELFRSMLDDIETIS